MRYILAVVLSCLFALPAYANCPDVEQRFVAYKSALIANSDLAQFFSRSYLEGLVNGFKTNDEAVLLHEANRARLLTRLAAVKDPGYSLESACLGGSATLNLKVPKGGDTNNVTFGFTYEDGAWRIFKLRLDINPTVQGHGI
jgi:hypothetical protein